MTISSELWGILSVALALVSLVPYIIFTTKGQNKPHVFTWAIWALLTVIAFLVQYTQNAGPGAWATGVSAVFTIVILLLSFKHGEKNITRSDWIAFIAALMAIPIWLMTKNPTLAAVWVTAIDVLAYYPTYRKSWRKPHEEAMVTHGIGGVKHMFSLMAMNVFSVPTALYPTALMVMNTGLFCVIGWRRYTLKATLKL